MTIMQLLIVVNYSTLCVMVFLLCLINTTPVSITMLLNVAKKHGIGTKFMVTKGSAKKWMVFSEREREFTFAICHRQSVCLSSVTFVRHTQAIEIFGDVSTPFGTLAIC